MRKKETEISVKTMILIFKNVLDNIKTKNEKDLLNEYCKNILMKLIANHILIKHKSKIINRHL